jgi:hypothetical protein
VQSKEGGVGQNGTAGPITLPLGSHEVSEEAVPPTDITDYNTSVECVDLANNNHVVVPETTGTSVSVPLTQDGQNVLCTITNTSTKFGEVTVIKRLIPADDTGRFDLLVDGSPPNDQSKSVGDGGTTGEIRLPFGPVDVSESAVPPTDIAHYDIETICTDEDNGGGTVKRTPPDRLSRSS